jgi:hypothetical protein
MPMRDMSCQVPDRAAPDWLAAPGTAIGPEDCDDDDGDGGVERLMGGRSQPSAATTTAASSAPRQEPVTASLLAESKTPLPEREVGADRGFAGW